MSASIIVVDDFYTDALQVRHAALTADFSVRGNFPGVRTFPVFNKDVFRAIQHLVGERITYWPLDGYNGAFQYTIESDRTWIHSDFTTSWSGVVYLTPDAPLASGTAFYSHRDTGIATYPGSVALQNIVNQDASDPTRWIETEVVANRFNRLVIFRGERFHASRSMFGNSKENGRLFQTFFFSTQA